MGKSTLGWGKGQRRCERRIQVEECWCETQEVLGAGTDTGVWHEGLSTIDDVKRLPWGVLTPPERLENVWAVCGLYRKRHRGNGAGKEQSGGGPLVLLSLLEMPQGPSLGRCCRSPCFFLRGFRAFCRTKEHRVGVCGMETRADPGGSSTMYPLPWHTRTPLFAPLCCSQPASQHQWGTHNPCCLYTPTWHIDIWEPGCLRSCWANPGWRLSPQTQHAMLLGHHVLNQVHAHEAGSSVLTSPPVPVLSPALRNFWPQFGQGLGSTATCSPPAFFSEILTSTPLRQGDKYLRFRKQILDF